MRFALVFTGLLLLSSSGFSKTIYVPDDYPTIQAAIDTALNGDTVLVKPGTYVENIDFMGKSITLKSEQGPDVTVIDGNQAGSVIIFRKSDKPESVIDGFTIKNGKTD